MRLNMLLKHKIDKKFRLKKNFKADEILGFYSTKDDVNGCRYDHYADSAFEAVILFAFGSFDKNENYKNYVNIFEDWFDREINAYENYNSFCELIHVEGRYENPAEFSDMGRYEEWATIILNYFIDENYIKPLKYEKYKLSLCWLGAEKIYFRGRNSFEVLESFAINHRKKVSNLEPHRFGLKKFLSNFKRDMVHYFGLDWGCDDDFVDALLELKIFKLDKGTANETVL